VVEFLPPDDNFFLEGSNNYLGDKSMATYLVTYEATCPQASSELDYMMTGLGAVQLGEHLWGLEIGLNESKLREWLESQLGVDHSVMVIQLRPSPDQISSVISPPAERWLARAQRRKIQ
jgi:hypothetical protein